MKNLLPAILSSLVLLFLASCSSGSSTDIIISTFQGRAIPKGYLVMLGSAANIAIVTPPDADIIGSGNKGGNSDYSWKYVGTQSWELSGGTKRTLPYEFDGRKNTMAVADGVFEMKSGNLLIVIMDNDWKPTVLHVGVDKDFSKVPKETLEYLTKEYPERFAK